MSRAEHLTCGRCGVADAKVIKYGNGRIMHDHSDECIRALEKQAGEVVVTYEARIKEHLKSYDTLNTKYRAAERELEQLRAQVRELEAQAIEAEQANEAMFAKVQSLSAHQTCACSYDTADDVCMHHSPKLKAAIERAEQAERERDALRNTLTRVSTFTAFKSLPNSMQEEVLSAIERTGDGGGVG